MSRDQVRIIKPWGVDDHVDFLGERFQFDDILVYLHSLTNEKEQSWINRQISATLRECIDYYVCQGWLFNVKSDNEDYSMMLPSNASSTQKTIKL